MKNLHLPLPEQTYAQLKLEAGRSGVAATTMAREAIQAWLKVRKRAQRQAEISAYASKMAGTALDLDPVLERAILELLRESEWNEAR